MEEPAPSPSSSPSKAKALYDPEISVDEGAIVAVKSNIHFMTSDGSPTSHDESLLPKVKVVVQFGTVFHPGSQLIVRLAPPPPPPDDHDDDNHDDNHHDTTPALVLFVGKNNLFEETCRVVLDLGTPACPWRRDEVRRRGHRYERRLELIGDFNRFAPRCRVRAGAVGTGNSFGASCVVNVPDGRVSDGVVVAPAVEWSTTATLSSFRGEETKEETTGEGAVVEDPYASDVLDNKVIFMWQGHVVPRPHQNGKERNVKELEAMLPAMRVVVRRYHKLLESEPPK